ncbi:MAG: helix-turn-helix transcriptional regulator [Planctomycetota bacterium]
MKKSEIIASSGNVFADMGVKEPEQALAKAKVVLQICKILKAKKLTQQESALLLGVDQPKISALLHGRIAGFSLERLLGFLTALDRDIEIVIKNKPKSRRKAHLLVYAQNS